ncbi:MAG: hypothetical protein H0W55_09260 [Actinobacteria bacterium]|nr:hypothetical protein [Actinomycetota bacterium]
MNVTGAGSNANKLTFPSLLWSTSRENSPTLAPTSKIVIPGASNVPGSK